MTDLFDKLYSQFLRGKTNRKDFEGFKESLNHLSDQELAERMEAFWDENTVFPSMEVGRKREIHRRLRLQIHPPKISIRWSRIVAGAGRVSGFFPNTGGGGRDCRLVRYGVELFSSA